MREFFRSWRRKVGCVTLAMACMTATVWVRSRSTADFVAFPWNGEQQVATCVDGQICWRTDYEFPFRWIHESKSDSREIDEILKRLAMLGELDSKAWLIPIWPIVVPLTLLSAYLLLWPQRRLRSTAYNSLESPLATTGDP